MNRSSVEYVARCSQLVDKGKVKEEDLVLCVLCDAGNWPYMPSPVGVMWFVGEACAAGGDPNVLARVLCGALAALDKGLGRALAQAGTNIKRKNTLKEKKEVARHADNWDEEDREWVD